MRFGVYHSTRCGRRIGHTEETHLGPGLALYGAQEIEWFPGDRREYITCRDEQCAWEGL